MVVTIPETVQDTNKFEGTKDIIGDYSMAFAIGMAFLIVFFVLSAFKSKD